MKTASNYMNNERSIPLHPPLARAFGDRAAIILQQIRFWMAHNEQQEGWQPEDRRLHYRDGRWWVFNTYDEWCNANFDFWSKATIERHIRKLEKDGVLITKSFNESKGDRTKWYTIDFDVMDALVAKSENRHRASRQNAVMVTSKCGDDDVKMTRSIYKDTESTTESTTETEQKTIAAPPTASGSEPVEDTDKPADAPPKPRKKTAHQLMFEAVCAAFGYDWNAITRSKKKNIGRIASELRAAGAKPENILAFYGWCKAQDWPDFTENVLATRWDDYRKTLYPARTNGKIVELPKGRPGCPACGGTGMMVDAAGRSVACKPCQEAEAVHERAV